MPTKFKLPTGPLSQDIEDKREEVIDPAGDRSRVITNIFREYDRYRSLGTKRGITNEDYMKNLSTARTRGLEEDMHGEAVKQMNAQAQHDATRSARRVKTAKEYKGVK